MRFENFWLSLTKILATKNDFETLKQEKVFIAKFSTDKVIVSPTSTQFERKIDKNQFLTVWNFAKKLPKYEQFKRGNYNKITRNGSYILALIKYILKDGDID